MGIRRELCVVFTDVVESTAVRARVGDAAADELRREHDALLGAIFARHAGRVVKHLGDGLMVVWDDPAAALDAVAEAQLELRRRNAGAAEAIKVRVGLSCGPVAEEDDDVFGMTVVTAARVCGLANADQVLLTTDVGSVAGAAPTVELGAATLKGIPEPVAISALRWSDDAPLGLPPGARHRNGRRAAPARAGQEGFLPPLHDDTIGRHDDLAELIDAIESGHRLVTLLGPGGAGKTRLSIELAGAVAGSFDDGAWFVDLSPLADGEALASHVGKVLGIADDGSLDGTQQVLRHCAGRRLLLVLDNCEHVCAEAADLVRSLMIFAPDIQIVATSQIALGVGGEHRWECPTLELDAAIDMMIARARAAGAPAIDDRAGLARVCEILDRLPLGIELAAPRLRALSPDQLASRLEAHPDAANRQAVGRPERHRSLAALVDWSVELLDHEQLVLFRRLAVFRGPCDLDSIADVCGFDPLDPLDIDLVLTDLVEHSLLRVLPGGSPPRYRLLRPIREHALGLLDDPEAAEVVRRLHARFARVFRERAVALRGPDQASAFSALDALHDDLTGLLRSVDGPLDDRDRADLFLAAADYFQYGGFLSEAREHVLALLGEADDDSRAALAIVLSQLENGLNRPDLAVRAGRAALAALDAMGEGRTAMRAEALLAIGDPRSHDIEPGDRLALLDDALAIAGEEGDRHLQARVLGARQWALDDAGSPADGLASGQEALMLAAEVGDRALEALLLDGISHSLLTEGRTGEAVAAAARGHELARRTGRRRLEGRLLGTHANALALHGDADTARTAAAGALAIATDISDAWLEGNARCYLGAAHLAAGNHDDALVVLLERPVDHSAGADPRKELMAAALTGWAALGAGAVPLAVELLDLARLLVAEVPVLRPMVVQYGAAVVHRLGDLEDAVVLAAAAGAHVRPGAIERDILDAIEIDARERFGDERLLELRAVGRAMAIDDALERAADAVLGAAATD